MKIRKQKHLTADARAIIEQELDKGSAIKDIAELIGKDPTTVAKEIKLHRQFVAHKRFNEPDNRCGLFGKCSRKLVCGSRCPTPRKLCRTCDHCNSRCPDFTAKSYHCERLDRSPHVCNGCDDKARCRLDRFVYRAFSAEREYRHTLVDARVGINATPDELARIDAVVSPLVKQGQSPYLIRAQHPEIAICERTIYSYIESGALSVKNIDLAKKVRYKKRAVHKSEIADRGVFVGRTYRDFGEFTRVEPDLNVVEMDTIVGCKGSSAVLLSLYLRCAGLQLYYWMPNRRSDLVKQTFDWLEQRLGLERFREVFPVILTDRGGEFARPSELETSTSGERRTRIFFCDPMASWQKGACEKNHEYVRKILPKGSSFDHLTSQDVRKMMCHINSAARAGRSGKTPYELARYLFGEQTMRAIGVDEIHADEVILTPKLLMRKK